MMASLQNRAGEGGAPEQVLPDFRPVNATTGVIVAPYAVGAVLLSAAVAAYPRKPLRVVCVNCNAEVVTAIQMESTWLPNLFACSLCVSGCCCLLFIPYCTDVLKNPVHVCPNCRARLGSPCDGFCN